jgi:hypothetical protein
VSRPLGSWNRCVAQASTQSSSSDHCRRDSSESEGADEIEIEIGMRMRIEIRIINGAKK